MLGKFIAMLTKDKVFRYIVLSWGIILNGESCVMSGLLCVLFFVCTPNCN